MKLGLWLLVAAAAFLWFNHVRKARPNKRAGGAVQDPAHGESIFACAHCGLHVPASDALVDLTDPAGACYCCEAHRRLHARA